MNKIKLIIFHPYSRIGGADLSISRLINNLDSNIYNISLITFKKPKINFYLKKKIKIQILKSTRTFLSIFEIRKIVKKEEKDKYSKIIFISNQNFANIISVLALTKINWIKLILIERNNPIELDFSKKLKDKLIKILIKFTYKYADKIISISKELSYDLKKICKKNVTTIYNAPIDLNKNNSIDKKIKKKKLHNLKIILNVARFEKQKNHFMLLESFKQIHNLINVKLILIGYGSEEKNIIKFIKENKLEKKILIIKNPKNIFEYYKIADLFVLTSIYEGFGNVLIEAGIFKLPIISTNCKSGPKEILNNGTFGDLVNIDDVETLSKLIIKNLEYPNKKKISKMYKSLKRFSIKKHILSYEKIFKQV